VPETHSTVCVEATTGRGAVHGVDVEGADVDADGVDVDAGVDDDGSVDDGRVDGDDGGEFGVVVESGVLAPGARSIPVITQTPLRHENAFPGCAVTQPLARPAPPPPFEDAVAASGGCQ